MFGLCLIVDVNNLLSFVFLPRQTLQSLIMSTAVPAIIGFSLWREVRLLFQSLHLLALFCVFKDTLWCSFLSFKYCPRVLAELSELQELYDSDLVELVNWIRWVRSTDFIFFFCLKKKETDVVSNMFLPFRSQAPLATVFAGSPQLLGMVKLCSGLAVTSLPLYSDINMLRRTENVSANLWKLGSNVKNKVLKSDSEWLLFNVEWTWLSELCGFLFRPTRCTEWDLLRTSIKFCRLKRPIMSSLRSPYAMSFSSTKAAAPKTCLTSQMDM